jgi:GNAT superfamily N-acetyltransferase
MPAEENIIFLSHVEPILAVSDILETINYWHDVLGFTNKWTWKDPPDYGGVTWQGVAVQFLLNARLAQSAKGNSIFIRVRNISELYRFHLDQKAEIVEPLENKPWGLSGYTVRENNGYYIVFAGEFISEKTEPVISTPAVKVISRLPTAVEYLDLVEAVGWGKYHDHSLVEKKLAAPIFAVVAEDEETKKAVGCVLLISDGGGFYYVKDLMVHPAWQNKRVGSMLMKALNDWLDQNAPKDSFVCLVTGERLANFYKQFDFRPAFAMVKQKTDQD